MRKPATNIRFTGQLHAAILAALDTNPDLEEWITAPDPQDPRLAYIKDYTFAGGGTTFLLDALRSLAGAGRPVHLDQAYNMDTLNRTAFINMLCAYLGA